MRALLQHITNYSRKINWVLLVFLLLVLNVKLLVKVAAIILISILQYRNISFKNIVRQRSLYFYIAMIAIAGLNFLLQAKTATVNQAMAVAFGTGLWIMAAAACYFIYQLVQKEEPEKLHATLKLFFLLHIVITIVKLLWIIIETGAINPYAYTGMHQKYYINTGDYITGITFDSPVTTGVISGFAIFYFLYRAQFILSFAAMISLLTVGSNLTNLAVGIVLLFAFIFHSDKARKSLIIAHLCLLVIFAARISPQNNEHTGRMVYKIIGKPFDTPKRNTAISYIKQQPDSLLNDDERKKKMAQLYIDSLSVARMVNYGLSKQQVDEVITKLTPPPPPLKHMSVDLFHVYEQAASVTDKIERYKNFMEEGYTEAERSTLLEEYKSDKPGKWIAFLQLKQFLQQHPRYLLTGTGTANFSSRTAFKVTALNIAGGYPAKFRYVHPAFRDRHLFLYLYYYSLSEDKHSTGNTPDSTYFQLLGEYGLLGVLAFVILYLGFYVRRIRLLTFGMPVMLLLLGLFMTEYWFEQLSIVILAETLLFTDLRTGMVAKQRRGELAV